MARMLPDVDPATLEHQSEAPVYVALRDALSDEYVVFHSYPWLRPDRGALGQYHDSACGTGKAGDPAHALIVFR